MCIRSVILAATLAFATLTHAKEPVRSLLEIRKNNVVVQQWDLSCGAAVLTTLLKYQHGIDVTEKEVATELIKRQEYIDNPNLLRINQGFSLLDLKRYVDNTGLTGNGYGQLTFDNLLQLVPVVVPVNLDGYNHFVIFRGIAADRVLLADPAWGNRTLSKSQLLAAWINFDKLGHVGFTITDGESNFGINRLQPTDMDFNIIR